MVFCHWDRPCRQDCPLTIKVESRGRFVLELSCND